MDATTSETHVRSGGPITDLRVSAYEIPTDFPEADGTLEWDKTTLVLVELTAGDRHGLGFTYGDVAVAELIEGKLASLVTGSDAFDNHRMHDTMQRQVRNLGHPGITAMAISAVDVALWDLKARLLELPLVQLLGAVADGIEVYGSGGFTSYSIPQLQKQLGDWTASGIRAVKMKIGTHPEDDLIRVRAAREAIGSDTGLFVDANGAYSRKQALKFAEAFADLGVEWFEEPVSSDDLEGLRLLRDRAPSGMKIAAGEYGYDLFYFRRMLEAGAVDVLQADGTRCGGITGFVHAGALALAQPLPFSAHTAPSIHAHPCCALSNMYNLEYFHDHVRIEHMLFDGTLTPAGGKLRPDLSRPGLGLEFKRADAERFAVR